MLNIRAYALEQPSDKGFPLEWVERFVPFVSPNNDTPCQFFSVQKEKTTALVFIETMMFENLPKKTFNTYIKAFLAAIQAEVGEPHEHNPEPTDELFRNTKGPLKSIREFHVLWCKGEDDLPPERHKDMTFFSNFRMDFLRMARDRNRAPDDHGLQKTYCYMVYDAARATYSHNKAVEIVKAFNKGFNEPIPDKKLTSALNRRNGVEYHQRDVTICSRLGISNTEFMAIKQLQMERLHSDSGIYERYIDINELFELPA